MIDPNIIAHGANLLYAGAYMVKEMFWLRILSIIACIAMIYYNYFEPDSPLWVAIGWNTFFVLVNSVHIGILLKERAGISFSEDEKEMYQTIFSTMSPVEFMKLLRKGKWEKHSARKKLIEKGDPVERLMLIYNGSVAIRSGTETLNELKDGAFLGEMAFISGNSASATVETLSNTRIFSWDFSDLKDLFERNPSLVSSFQQAITADMASKLQNN